MQNPSCVPDKLVRYGKLTAEKSGWNDLPSNKGEMGSEWDDALW
jgi:hypothetical protein